MRPLLGLCAICDLPVTKGTPGTRREVSGWQRIGSSGALNDITSIQPTGRVICAVCADSPSIPQETLL